MMRLRTRTTVSWMIGPTQSRRWTDPQSRIRRLSEVVGSVEFLHQTELPADLLGTAAVLHRRFPAETRVALDARERGGRTPETTAISSHIDGSTPGTPQICTAKNAIAPAIIASAKFRIPICPRSFIMSHTDEVLSLLLDNSHNLRLDCIITRNPAQGRVPVSMLRRICPLAHRLKL